MKVSCDGEVGVGRELTYLNLRCDDTRYHSLVPVQYFIFYLSFKSFNEQIKSRISWTLFPFDNFEIYYNCYFNLISYILCYQLPIIALAFSVETYFLNILIIERMMDMKMKKQIVRKHLIRYLSLSQQQYLVFVSWPCLS